MLETVEVAFHPVDHASLSPTPIFVMVMLDFLC